MFLWSHFFFLYVYDSIRVVFSIAELQSDENNFESQEDEEAPSDAGEASYPLRCSITITKVPTFSYTSGHGSKYVLCYSLLFLVR